jgi:hypothetical protein
VDGSFEMRARLAMTEDRSDALSFRYKNESKSKRLSTCENSNRIQTLPMLGELEAASTKKIPKRRRMRSMFEKC